MIICVCVFFFFKQKTAYEMRISDWSSDVCSSDLLRSILLGSDDLDQLPIVDEDDLYPMRKMCRQNLRSKLVDRDPWPVEIMEAAIRRTVILPERLGMRIVDVEILFIDVQTPRCNEEFEISFSEIGRASCRERVCQYVSIWVVAVSLK